MLTGSYTPDRYNTDGAQTIFDITFEFEKEDNIHVWARNKTTDAESELTNPTDFSVNGATIVTVDVWPEGYEFIIKRILSETQNTDYIRNDSLPSEKVEVDFDDVVKMIQQHSETLSRIPQLKQSSEHSDIELDDPQDGYSLIWDGGKLKNARQFGSGSYAIKAFMEIFLESLNQGAAQSNLGISDFVKTLLDDASASDFLTALGFSSFIKTLIDDANAATARITLGVTDPIVEEVSFYSGSGIADPATRTEDIGDRTGDTVSKPGWKVANGLAGTSNMLDRFLRMESVAGNTGGSDDAIVVSHNHTGTTGNQSVNHSHNYARATLQQSLNAETGVNGYSIGTWPSTATSGVSQGHTHNFTTSTEGMSGAGANKPAYYSLIPIIKMS